MSGQEASNGTVDYLWVGQAKVSVKCVDAY